MRRVLLSNGVMLVTVLVSGFLPLSGAIHGHRHGDVLGRVMNKPRPGGSVSNSTNSPQDQKGLPVVHAGPSHAIPCPDKACSAFTMDTIPSNFDGFVAAPSTDPKIPGGAQATVDDTYTRRRLWLRPTRIQSQAAISTGSDASGAASGGKHLPHVLSPRQDDSYQSFVLGPFPRPTSTSAAPVSTSTSVCPGGNGTTFTSAANVQYQILCDIDFVDNDYPFQRVDTFEECVRRCDAYNVHHKKIGCLASLFVPSRETYANDCYLKSSVAHPSLSTLGIQGAVRLSGNPVSSVITSSASGLPSSPLSSNTDSNTGIYGTSASLTSDTSTESVAPVASNTVIGTSSKTTPISSSSVETTSRPTSSLLFQSTGGISSSASSIESSSSTSVNAATSSASPSSGGSGAGTTYASGNEVIPPKVAGSHLHGPTANTPTKQYIDIGSPSVIQLAQSLLTTGVNGDLTTGYGMAPNTGVLDVNITTQSFLRPLSGTPHLSRDGGRGGMVNGQHLFIFCDTGSYTTTTAASNGNFLGFVSSSCAVDTGMNGLNGQPLNLQDGIGEWSDDTGRQRGFAPLTEGELAYNLAKQGNGQRYAVWPESSIIPLDASSGLLYAPIVYDNVNRATKATVFTYTGATLLTVTAGNKGGPSAERTVDKIFDQDEVEWGCAGGIRSWGPSGIGGSDGLVYIFGNVGSGILAGRTQPSQVANRESYEYWDGNSWTNSMQTSTSKAFWIPGQLMDVDVFYSPRHLTFIIVYMNVYADSTLYFRYLEADQGILPPFAPGGDASSDYVENLFKYSWSDEQVLYKASPGLSGKYAYAGGVHQGYYGSNDITNGGSRMLISWTAPTGQDPSTLISEYQIITAEIEWA